MEQLHHHCNHMPKVRGNLFHACDACRRAKLKHRSINTTNSSVMHRPILDQSKQPKQPSKAAPDDSNFTSIEIPASSSIDHPQHLPGQQFHMDFGFMRGSGFIDKDSDRKTITSIDGKQAYLIIIDLATCYGWVFLTVTSCILSNIL
jgi:hypothetical protein